MDDTEFGRTPLQKKKHKPVGVAARAATFPCHFAYTHTALAFRPFLFAERAYKQQQPLFTLFYIVTDAHTRLVMVKRAIVRLERVQTARHLERYPREETMRLSF
jgi:hypothetical protein